MKRNTRLTTLMLAALLAGLSPMAWAAGTQAATQNSAKVTPTTQTASQQTWTINVHKADIRAFVKQIADMTGKNFVLDPRVRAKDITVISRQPLTADEVYQLFLSVLQVNGYAAVESDDGVVKIVPNTTAKSYNLPMASRVHGSEGALVTKVLPVDGLKASELVPVLRPLVPQYGHLAAVRSANALVVSDHKGNIERLEAIISGLEHQGSNGIGVIRLQHAWVGDVVKQLKNLVPQVNVAGKGKEATGGSAVLVADERTNRLLMRGSDDLVQRIRSIVSKLDVRDAQQGNYRVVRLEHGDAKEIAKLLNQFFGDKAKKEGNPEMAVAIHADESLNALVVKAGAGKMKEVMKLIKQLDVRRAQVLIQAAIIEVSANKSQSLGMQWVAGDLSYGVGGTNFSNSGLSVNDILKTILGSQTGAVTSVPSLSNGITAGYGGFHSDGTLEWAGILQALATDSAVNLLSTPSILTLDNQEASIMVGENVPFVTGQSTNTGSGVSNPFQTIQRQDVGITLKVTPHLGSGNLMRLELDQKVSSVKPASSSISNVDITTSKRQIKTTVLAEDGQTIVLGGLIQDDIKTEVSKVPLLGDIPIIGALFRSTKQVHKRSNLMLFLRPVIVHNNDKLVSLTRNRYLGLVALQFRLSDDGELERIQEHPLPLEVDHVFDGRKPAPKSLKEAVGNKLKKKEAAAAHAQP